MKHHARLIVSGNIGIPARPAYAFDLTRGALVNGARKTGVTRYGEPEEAEDDARPLALKYTLQTVAAANEVSAWTKGDVNDDLQSPRWTFGERFLMSRSAALPTATRTDTPVFTSTTNLIGTNQAFAVTFFIERLLQSRRDWPSLISFRWGVAGAGFLFQVQNGTAELAALSPQWTQALHDDWQFRRETHEPTGAQEAEEQALAKRIFTSFQSLSLKSNVTNADWFGRPITITFVPESRGALHVLLEGGNAVALEVPDILKTKAAGNLWTATPLVVSGRYCDFGFQFLRPRFAPVGTIEYGPLRLPPYDNPLQGITYRISADQGGGTVALDVVSADANYATPDDGSLEAQLSTLPGGWFGLRATLTAGTSTPWLYGLSARTPQGAFVRGEDVVFDTANLYKPASYFPPDADNPNDTEARERGNPILDINTTTEANGERHGSILIRDVNGLTFADVGTTNNPGIAGILNRRANCSIVGRDESGNTLIADGAHFTQALLTGARYTDVARYAFYPPGGGAAQQGSTATAKGETRAEIDWHDGWYLLKERKCTPPQIHDNLRLGAAINAVLGVCGFTLTEGIGAGPIIDGAALGEAWASTNDANARCSDVINGLMDRYGLGLRISQDRLGAWRLRPLATAYVATFVSTGALNRPNISGGTRYIIKADFDWYFDYSNYYNSFRLIWGDKGQFQTISRIEESIYQPNYTNYLGREREYDDVVATDIRTAAAAQYAIRSLKFRYGRFTKFAQSSTYYHRDLEPGDPISIDGLGCELQSIGGTSIRNDALQMVWGKYA